MGIWRIGCRESGRRDARVQDSLDGGPPIRLRDTLSFNPVWSPDDRFIVEGVACLLLGIDVKTMTPDGAPVVVPAVASLGPRFVVAFGTPYRFMPGGKALITLQGTAPGQNFFRLDLETASATECRDYRLALCGGFFDPNAPAPCGSRSAHRRHLRSPSRPWTNRGSVGRSDGRHSVSRRPRAHTPGRERDEALACAPRGAHAREAHSTSGDARGSSRGSCCGDRRTR
jgi:hypothetical protein